MNAFIDSSRSQTTNLAVMAPGIAEALLATAPGSAPNEGQTDRRPPSYDERQGRFFHYYAYRGAADGLKAAPP